MLLGVLLLISLAFASTQDLINQYCSGNPDCFLCTDGNTIGQCYQNRLCTVGMEKCSLDVLDLDDGKSAILYLYKNVGIEVRNGKIRLYADSVQGNWVDLNSSGITEIKFVMGWYLDYMKIEVDNYRLKFCYRVMLFQIYDSGYMCGSWIEIGKDGLSRYGSSIIYLESSSTKGIRLVYEAKPFPSYGRWIPLKKAYTCPLGNYPCIKYTDGNYYCSSYECYDVQNTPTQITDTPEGINDKRNDGTITDRGCTGTIYIFNGQDMRCRPPGVQTGFSDCCKKTKRWFGLVNCSQREQQLAKLRSWGKLDGNCHYVGEYCSEKWLGTCVQKKKTYCCFSSPLARIIHEYGRPQLGIGWGSPESPNCRGFTPEEFQKLDFSKIDFSEWIEEEVKANISPSIQTSISSVIQNVQSSFAGGSP